MPNNEKIAGRSDSTARSRADIASREFKMGLLTDMKRALCISDRQGTAYEVGIYVVGYVSMDVVILSAPASQFEEDTRTRAWHAVFAALGRSDLSSLVLLEHAIGEDGITGQKVTGPVTVDVANRDGTVVMDTADLARDAA